MAMYVGILYVCILDERHSEHTYTKKENPKRRQSKEKKICTAQPHADHDYISSSKPPTKFNAIYEDFVKSYNQEGISLNDTDRANLASFIFFTPDVNVISDIIYSVPELRKCMTEKQRKQISIDISNRNKRNYDKTVIMEKQSKDMHNFNWFPIISEFKSRFPDLFCVLLSMLLKPEETSCYTKLESVLPRIGMVYSILMQGRHRELSATSVVSMFLFDNISDQNVSCSCITYEVLHSGPCSLKKKKKKKKN